MNSTVLAALILGVALVGGGFLTGGRYVTNRKQRRLCKAAARFLFTRWTGSPAP